MKSAPPLFRAFFLTVLALLIQLVGLTSSSYAAFGVVPGSYTASLSTAQAGAHPDLTVGFALNLQGSPPDQLPDGNVKAVDVTLPPGLVGDAQVVPACSPSLLSNQGYCPASTQVGVVTYTLGGIPLNPPQVGVTAPIYNMVPTPAHPAELAFFNRVLAFVKVPMLPEVLPSRGYRLSTVVPQISSNLKLFESSVTLWGVPADASHDGERGLAAAGGCLGQHGPTGGTCPSDLRARAFLANPPQCASAGTIDMTAASWQQPETFIPTLFSSPFQMTGCDALRFEPSLTVQPETLRPDAPAGYTVTLHLPQSDSPTDLATPHLRKAVVTLPAGVRVSPSAATGLQGCSDAQLDLHGDADASCPEASKIGTVKVHTPLLAQPLEGTVYQGTQTSQRLLRIFIVAKGPGVIVKLSGSVSLDPHTGQITATFDDNPQLPFEDLVLRFRGGPRAPLVNPRTCGAKTTTATLTSWDGSVATTTDSFDIFQDGSGVPCSASRFSPILEAGSASPIAAAHTPFTLRLTREDGTQRLTALSVSPPPGLLASLRGIPYCSDAALGAIPTGDASLGLGAAQLASPSCPAASRIGSVTAAAGAGPNPFFSETGRAYLAGPYRGAPLSLAVVVPALAGPFDLGNVVVRTALQVNPETTQIDAVSDPIPTTLDGIPLDLRDLRIDLDRPDFTLNPTSCDEMAIDGTASGDEGASAPLHDRFQLGECGRLPFGPSLSLKLKGPVNRTANPKLIATLRMPTTTCGLRSGHAAKASFHDRVCRAAPPQANISRAQVRLPPSALLDNSHIRGVCTRLQYAAGSGGGEGCPQNSIYGFAKATTPLLDKPLEGPVYLRSSSHTLPDLVASLNGQIHVDLVGKTDSVKGALRNTFQAVPDAPVSKFTLTLFGGKRGLIEMSSGFCSHPRASVKLDAHSGKIHDARPVVAAMGCRAKKHQRRR